ncbi:protein unc-93 homolog A-like [Pseudophryne corroboree]|uniref:protein unc-93 homolog A-like n=1 Tax=Pseudophryne corroboree TaxID=495146 RepID=UPI003081AA94
MERRGGATRDQADHDEEEQEDGQLRPATLPLVKRVILFVSFWDEDPPPVAAGLVLKDSSEESWIREESPSCVKLDAGLHPIISEDIDDEGVGSGDCRCWDLIERREIADAGLHFHGSILNFYVSMLTCDAHSPIFAEGSEMVEVVFYTDNITILNNTDCGASEALLLETQSLSNGNLSQEFGNWSQTGSKPTQPSNFLIYIILGAYVACGLLALLLIIVFLDPIDHQREDTNLEHKENFWAPFLASLKHLRDKRQCLLIPLTVYSGIVQGFILSDYTKSYVTCSLGLQYVGYVIIVYGATTAIFSYIFGKLSQYIRRISFFILATVINISSISALFLWKPHPSQLGVFFIFSGFWGIGDAVWQTLLNGFYGILFEDNREAAFANYQLWKSLGYVLSFGYSSFLGVYVKLCILLATLLLGILLYMIVEYIELRKTQIQIIRLK